ncbi:MAG: hypothetical protein MJY61_00310 [Bacteroidales bacterium]|nr:hypothetical protein [Bacteroidales bacterium]
MKKIVLAISIALMFAGTDAFAQGRYGADSAECVKHLSYYREYYKQKNYADALPNWMNAYKVCPPTATENLFINGSTLMNMQIQKTTGEERAEAVRTLLKLQDERAAYYPKNAAKALNNKAEYIVNYLQEDPESSHRMLSEIIEANGSLCSPRVLEGEMHAILSLFQEGKTSAEEVMNYYSKAMTLFDQISPDADKYAESKGNLQGLFLNSKVADCDQLQALFTPRLAAEPENLSLIKTIVSMLNAAENCAGNDLYLKAVTSLYNMEPSYSSAYALYLMNMARDNESEAEKYLEEAASSEDAPVAQKADYNLEYAGLALKNGSVSKAVSLANKVVSFAPEKAGQAYLVIARAWAAAKCGGDEINAVAHFWVAADYASKAKAADPSLAEDANKLISRYSVYYPTAAEAFMYDLTNGSSYTVNCSGMSATTTARFNK